MNIHLSGTLWVSSAIAVGTGLHVATWGAFKDSPYEGFRLSRMLRTLLLAQVAAGAAVAAHLVEANPLIPAIGVVYTLERLATEWWKTIMRGHNAAAFTIPMRLAVRGRPVDVAWQRYCVGTAVVLVMVAAGEFVHRLQGAFPASPGWLVVATVGGLGGWATALGGAWKDAPIEGFSGWKFLRSPVVATAWAIVCAPLTDDWVTLCLASGGFAVASIETYKTFLTGDRAPGKFAGQEPRDHRLLIRRVLGRLHATAWACFALAALWVAVHPVAPAPRFAGLPTAAWAGLGAAGAGVAACRIVFRANQQLCDRSTASEPSGGGGPPGSAVAAPATTRAEDSSDAA